MRMDLLITCIALIEFHTWSAYQTSETLLSCSIYQDNYVVPLFICLSLTHTHIHTCPFKINDLTSFTILHVLIL
jgi:hypothetical protein